MSSLIIFGRRESCLIMSSLSFPLHEQLSSGGPPKLCWVQVVVVPAAYITSTLISVNCNIVTGYVAWLVAVVASGNVQPRALPLSVSL